MHPETDLSGLLARAYREQLQSEAVRQRVLKLAARQGVGQQRRWARLVGWLRPRPDRGGSTAPTAREVAA